MKFKKVIFSLSLLCISLSSCSISFFDTSKSKNDSSSQQPEDYYIYAVNDFHGSILERENGYWHEGGMSKVFGYLKAKKAARPNNTVIISSGDMWQGSLESNSNYGKLITEAMNAVPFDAMTLGNHDFDYGIDKLLENKELANFPFLAGNIVDYSTGNKWDKVAPHHIVDLNGVKIGIIGSIGQGQTTSILSSNVSSIDFKSPYNSVVTSSNYLKSQGCSLIIGSFHDSYNNVIRTGNYSRYLNGVLCGHSHSSDLRIDNGIPYIQGACNGEEISELHFRYDGVNFKYIGAKNIEVSTTWADDSDILQIQNNYLNDSFQEKSNKKLGTLSGTYLTSSTVANLGSKAIYEYVVNNSQFDICCAMQNSQRAGISLGDFTYSDLYKAMPFLNKIIIMEIAGEDLINEAQYNSTYTGDLTNYSSLDSDRTYQIAIVDYVGLHQNVSKQYDYFPSLNDHPERILSSFDVYPMDITSDYITEILNGSVNGYDYSNSGPGLNLYKL